MQQVSVDDVREGLLAQLGTFHERYLKARRRDAAAARAKYARALPVMAQAKLHGGEVLRGSGQLQQAAESFRAAAQLAGDMEAPRVAADANVRLALALLAVDDVSGAARALTDAIRLAPRNGQLLVRRAALQERLGFTLLAVEDLSAALQLELPLLVEQQARRRRGQLFHALGRHRLAIADLRTLQRAGPREVLAQLAASLVAVGEWVDAEALLTRVLDMPAAHDADDDDLYKLHLHRAKCREKLGRLRLAVADLTIALNRRCTTAALSRRARITVMMATAVVEDRSVANAAAQRGRLLRSALADYRRCVELEPDNRSFQMLVGVVAEDVGDDAVALPLFERAGSHERAAAVKVKADGASGEAVGDLTAAARQQRMQLQQSVEPLNAEVKVDGDRQLCVMLLGVAPSAAPQRVTVDRTLFPVLRSAAQQLLLLARTLERRLQVLERGRHEYRAARDAAVVEALLRMASGLAGVAQQLRASMSASAESVQIASAELVALRDSDNALYRLVVPQC